MGWLGEFVEVLGYPPSLLIGACCGLFIRRWWIAALLSAVLCPLVDRALNEAFSDAQPRWITYEALLFSAGGATVAVAVWLLKTWFLRLRPRNRGR